MLKSISGSISKPSVLRRILFAVTQLPRDLPNLWEVVVDFASNHGSKERISAQEAKLLIENIQELDMAALDGDQRILLNLKSILNLLVWC